MADDPRRTAYTGAWDFPEGQFNWDRGSAIAPSESGIDITFRIAEAGNEPGENMDGLDVAGGFGREDVEPEEVETRGRLVGPFPQAETEPADIRFPDPLRTRAEE